ncbi:aminotransferase class I/II-fold pyridoxal phosphate-dependent enzyme [bacterium AH-315-C07]|nr:aminotransferase class I/II-fold pyridoxal phosphate-dependent enzyme [bacterium AH-315-C07]
MHVPYGKTVHGEEEIEAVVHVLRTSTQMGKHVYEFEEKVAKLFDKKYGIMLNSGSSANYLAIELLNLPEGSEIITPTLTFGTTIAPLLKFKLMPAFIDVEDGTYNLDADKVEEMITDKTKALMIPNLLGNLPDWIKLWEIAEKYNLKVIEDSCDTLGATINGESSGKHSDISISSFYGSHVINCAGNGGIMCVNDDALMERGKLLRSWGRSSSLFVESEKIENRFNVELEGIRYDAKFVFTEPGYNWEPSEMGAAFGLVQLTKLEGNIDARTNNFNVLHDYFKKYEDWFIMPKQLPESKTGWLAYALTVKESAPFTRTELQIFFENRNIQTRTVFTGNVLRQPGYKNIERKESIDGYPAADRVMKGGILVGCHHGMNEAMLDHIKESFEVFAQKH